MALKPLSSKEKIGDSATHFFKTGNVLRKPDEHLQYLHSLLPKNGPDNTRVEYDIWYDMNDAIRIHGYTYTDVLSKFLYLRVGDAKRTHNIMLEAAKSDITPEGEAVFQDLIENSQDKYKLRKAKDAPKFVIFLAGANILNKAVDWEAIDHHVKINNAKLKCHPLTSRDLYQLLCQRYGKENIIDKKLSGHQLLDSAERVGCAENSEMGIIAMAKGKKFVSIGCGNEQLTYSAIYNTLKRGDPVERLKRILSCEYCGLVPAILENPKERVDSFFNYYKEWPHVSPQNNNN